MNLADLMLHIVNVPTLIAAIYAFINYPKFEKKFRVVSVFVFLSLIVQLISQYLSWKSTNNLFLLHFFVPVSFVVLSLFYQKVFHGFIHKSILPIIALVFCLFSILNSCFLQSTDTFNSYALSLESLLLVIYSLSLFILLLNSSAKDENQKWVASLVWINHGVFIYYSVGLLLFYFSEWLIDLTVIDFKINWLIHSIIHMIFYVCILIGLWKHPKN